MRVTFKSYDYDTDEIVVKFNCAHCGMEEKMSLSEIADQLEISNPTMIELLERIPELMWHWKGCVELNYHD